MLRLQITAFAPSADYERGRHQATLPYDVTLEDIMVPGFWATVANRVKPGSIIEAFRPDYSLDVDLRVIKVEKGLVVVHLRGGYWRQEYEDRVSMLRANAAAAVEAANNPDLPAVPPPDEGLSPDYKIGAAGGRFYVQFKPTKESIFTGLLTRAEAVAKVKEHMAKSGVEPAAA